MRSQREGAYLWGGRPIQATSGGVGVSPGAWVALAGEVVAEDGTVEWRRGWEGNEGLEKAYQGELAVV